MLPEQRPPSNRNLPPNSTTEGYFQLPSHIRLPEEEDKPADFTPIEPLEKSYRSPGQFETITAPEPEEGSSQLVAAITPQQIASLDAMERVRAETAVLWQEYARASGTPHFTQVKIPAAMTQPEGQNITVDLFLQNPPISPNLLLTEPQNYVGAMFMHRLNTVRQAFNSGSDQSELSRVRADQLAVARTVELISEMNPSQQENFWGVVHCGNEVKAALANFLIQNENFLPLICDQLIQNANRQLLFERLTRPLEEDELNGVRPVQRHVSELQQRILNDAKTQHAVLSTVSLALNSDLRPTEEERQLTWRTYGDQKEDTIKVVALSNPEAVRALRQKIDDVLKDLMVKKTEPHALKGGYKVRLWTGVYGDQKILAKIALNLRAGATVETMQLSLDEQKALAAYLRDSGIPLSHQIVHPKKPFSYHRLEQLGSTTNGTQLFTDEEFGVFLRSLPPFWQQVFTDPTGVTGELKGFLLQYLPDQVTNWQFFVANRQQALHYWQEFETLVRSKIKKSELKSFSSIDLLELWMSFASLIVERSKQV